MPTSSSGSTASRLRFLELVDGRRLVGLIGVDLAEDGDSLGRCDVDARGGKRRVMRGLNGSCDPRGVGGTNRSLGVRGTNEEPAIARLSRSRVWTQVQAPTIHPTSCFSPIQRRKQTDWCND